MVRSACKVLFNPNIHDVLVALIPKDIKCAKLLKKAKSTAFQYLAHHPDNLLYNVFGLYHYRTLIFQRIPITLGQNINKEGKKHF